MSSQFQFDVAMWMNKCFTPEIIYGKEERNHRFLEEALELVQSLDCTREEAHMLVDYVYDRKKGDPHQELGGVMVTLAALCNVYELAYKFSGDEELKRINTPEVIEKIREKQKTKPASSPLPGVSK
jgi:NTP pyrophosphatase (non-canonical NTP hydrolase)